MDSGSKAQIILGPRDFGGFWWELKKQNPNVRDLSSKCSCCLLFFHVLSPFLASSCVLSCSCVFTFHVFKVIEFFHVCVYVFWVYLANYHICFAFFIDFLVFHVFSCFGCFHFSCFFMFFHDVFRLTCLSHGFSSSFTFSGVTISCFSDGFRVFSRLPTFPCFFTFLISF